MTQALTKDEVAELEALEKEEADRQKDEALAAKRQHLEALRMVKRLAPKHGKPGRDFVVCETSLGVNVAIRRPKDVEVDGITENSERPDLEKLIVSLTLEPGPAELQEHMANHAGLVGGLMRKAMDMGRALREEEAKK